MKKGDCVAQLVGWPYHGLPPADRADLDILANGQVHGWNGEARRGAYATTIYRRPKGNLVFSAGTCWWNMALSTPPGFMNLPRRYFLQADPRAQRITRNILDKMIAAHPVE